MCNGNFRLNFLALPQSNAQESSWKSEQIADQLIEHLQTNVPPLDHSSLLKLATALNLCTQRNLFQLYKHCQSIVIDVLLLGYSLRFLFRILRNSLIHRQMKFFPFKLLSLIHKQWPITFRWVKHLDCNWNEVFSFRSTISRFSIFVDKYNEKKKHV